MANFKNTNITDSNFINITQRSTAQRSSSASSGAINFNTDFNQLDVYGNQWRGERGYLYYSEELNAAEYLDNWNDNFTRYFRRMLNLGGGTAHGWDDGPATFTLSLNDLPAHSEIKYLVLIHGQDTLDNERSRLYTQNDDGSDRLIVQFTRGRSSVNYESVDSGTRTDFISGSYNPSPRSQGGGAQVIETAWYPHSRTDFFARHELGADQDWSDESMMITHSTVWLR